MSVTAESQRLEALAYGNQVRLNNARTKRWVHVNNKPGTGSKADKAESRRRAVDVLVNQHERQGVGRMKVIHLLLSMRGFGDARAHSLLLAAHVSPARRLEDLTQRQVMLIADALLADAERLDGAS